MIEKLDLKKDAVETVYISGAISGIEPAIVRADFAVTEEQARKTFPGCAIFNPFKVGMVCPGNWSYEQIMNFDLDVLRNCSHIVMMEGWQASRGAKIEYEFAKEHGIEIWVQKGNEIIPEQNKEPVKEFSLKKDKEHGFDI